MNTFITQIIWLTSLRDDTTFLIDCWDEIYIFIEQTTKINEKLELRPGELLQIE